MSEIAIVLIIIAIIVGFSMIKVLPEWDRGVVLRFGRLQSTRGPGIVLLIPGIERMIRIDTRTITMDVQPQDVISFDNVSLKVNAVIYFRVVSPEDAVTKIADYYFATSQLSQTTLRSVCGQYSLDDLLNNREKINHTLQVILDKATEPWGVKVSLVELKYIDLPKDMQRAMAKQAEAERERRAKVISAQGELERSQTLSEASNKLAESPSALQLAFLQTIAEITGEGKTTIVMPVPLDLFKPFISDHPSP